MTRLLIAAATLTLIAGCSPPAVDNSGTSANVTEETKATPPKPVRTKTPEESFADGIASADAYAVAAGRMAEQKGGSDAVKAFGKALYDGHSRSTMELKYAAKDVDGGIFIDPSLSEEQSAKLKALEAANGAAFDAALKEQQVPALTQQVDALETYRTKGKHMPLQSYAYTTLPRIRALLTKAKAL